MQEMNLQKPKLYMVLLGCRPKGRNTEQHDVMFYIGNNIKESIPFILAFWPEAKGNAHIDAWREVTHVDGFDIHILPKLSSWEEVLAPSEKIFFINLGGYLPGLFDELHHKALFVAKNKEEAVKQAKELPFYKTMGFADAPSHVDDKFGIDVDDVHKIKDILPEPCKIKYSISLIPNNSKINDVVHLGYFRLEDL